MPFLLLLVACSTPLPDPEVQGAEPDWGYNGERTDVVVRGRHFYPSMELSSSDEGGRLDRQFQVRLEGAEGTYALQGVELDSYESLAAVVPEGLPVGLYALRVTTPAGLSAVLADAFTVTDSRADHLAFDLDSIVFDVNIPFLVAFDLLDPEDRPVFQPLRVVLTLTAASRLHGLEVDASGLDDALQGSVDEGVVVVGFLDESGHGWVSLTHSTPEILTLEVEPAVPDSVVEGDSVDIAVTPGELAGVSIDLPYLGFSAVAGEPFPVTLRMVDIYGNLLEEAIGRFSLTEACGRFSQTVDVVGRLDLDIAVTGATGDACEENRILASGTTSGSSPGFQVEPAEPSSYGVSVYPSTVEAGQSPLYVVVTARDAWENRVLDYGSDVRLDLYDTLGGLDPEAGLGEQDCPGFSEGIQVCVAWPWIAGADDQVQARGSDRLEGISGVFGVSPGPLAKILVGMGPGPVSAGEPFLLDVTPQDALKNGISTDPSVDGYRFRGRVGTPTCTWDEVMRADGSRRFSCIATLATDAETLTVSVDDLDPSVSGTTTPFIVQNGDLAVVSFDLEPGIQVSAGASFPVGLEGTDAWGNPYVVQSDPYVELEDETGSLLPLTATLDPDGYAEVEVTITVALQDDTITASQGAASLGTSDPFDVVPSDPASLSISLDRPWAFLDVPYTVRVQAVDAWGNVVLTFDEVVSVTSEFALSPGVVLDSWTDGEASGEILFDTPGVADSLIAVAETSAIMGVLTPIDVLEDDCGVTADLLVDGATEAVLCLASGSASAMLDASGSTGSSLTYSFWDSAGNTTRGSSATPLFAWEEPVAVQVEVAAFTPEACGDLAQAVVYVAHDDGQPAGPVSVVPTFTTRTVGSATTGSTPVDLAAWDCSGDVASGGSLLVRADLGEYTSGASASGIGLAVTLDAGGEATVSWSVALEAFGGTATLLAGNGTGTAIGAATVEAQGDNARPVVLDLDPRGTSDDVTDTVTVTFSEAMWSSSFTDPSAGILVSDSYGARAIADISLSADATQATATLEDAIDLSLDVYEIVVSSQVRDAAGNRLDGAWSGTTGAFRTNTGAVEDTAPDVLDCTPDTAVFRPDGDDVPGTSEADEVHVEVVASAMPYGWRLAVTDEAGDAVYTWWTLAAADADEVIWNGVGQDGIVVDNGAYVLQIAACDAYLNLGEACEVEVTVDNRLVGAP
ncbi:MAG: Ig-like domain-containing protein [Deltaproteobacteria bacterium]|nr:Ig-like domain-containing protein [Deltaproteobacteria bacterium]